MRTILIFSLLASATFAETYSIDNAHTAATFSVRHMMVSNVRGQLGKVNGSIQYDPKNLAASKVSATIDLSGINTNEPKRDAHLKSPDFFDVAKYPTITFEGTKWWKEGNKTKVGGQLTIHGITKPVVLDVEISPVLKSAQGTRIGALATTKINRKDFGLAWNQALEAGGVAIGDEVQVTLDIEGTTK